MKTIAPFIHLPGGPQFIQRRHATWQTFATSVKELSGTDTSVLGMAVGLSNTKIVSVAFATTDCILLVTVDSQSAKKLSAPANRGETEILPDFITVAGFQMAHLAVQFWRDLRCHVRGIDLSTFISPSPREVWRPSKVLGLDVDTSREIVRRIDALWDMDGEEAVCHRAWISAMAVQQHFHRSDACLKADTRYLMQQHLDCLGQMLLQFQQLDMSKPSVVENEFSDVVQDAKDEFTIHNSRYTNRVRRSEQTTVIMTSHTGEEIQGRAVAAQGKKTTIVLNKGHYQGNIKSIKVIGREELTCAETARNEFILLVLQGKRSLDGSLFNRLLFFPKDSELQTVQCVRNNTAALDGLNQSQTQVAIAMIEGISPLVIAHGPPGTGKTSTISVAVKNLVYRGHCVWITAQSNVGVKSIAESLVRRNVEFKLLVSKEFYVEWHEHLYEEIEHSLIRTDEFPPDPGAVERLLGGTEVILCTLSTLSNPTLTHRRVFDLLPVQKLVIDEASQINTFEFMHLFDKFDELEKVCLFGDPKQLPPYGQDNAPGLQSVFDVRHLRSKAHFLNTQYRMPIPLGYFISRAVYDSKLLSEHKILDMGCVSFVDVTKGCETRQGKSWMNMEEVHTIVNLVRHYYRHQDFCVITPYDAQRAALQMQLKAENLPWERVFNVDSFQGNEAAYVIISAVRTTGPGFLRSRNRMNVMLTRCKAGMLVVTNQRFLKFTGARETLLAELARHWETEARGDTWIDWKQVADATADLPGHCRSFSPAAVSPFRPSSITPKVHSSSPQMLESWSPSASNPLSISAVEDVMSRLSIQESKDNWPSLQSNKPAKITRPTVWNSNSLKRSDIFSLKPQRPPSMNTPDKSVLLRRTVAPATSVQGHRPLQMSRNSRADTVTIGLPSSTKTLKIMGGKSNR